MVGDALPSPTAVHPCLLMMRAKNFITCVKDVFMMCVKYPITHAKDLLVLMCAKDPLMTNVIDLLMTHPTDLLRKHAKSQLMERAKSRLMKCAKG